MIMEDVVPPQADLQFHSLRERGRFETAIAADAGIDWIAAKDIGAFAAAAFADPERFHGHEIDLAAETFTLPEVAAKMAKTSGKPVTAVTFSAEERLTQGYDPMHFAHEIWNNGNSRAGSK